MIILTFGESEKYQQGWTMVEVYYLAKKCDFFYDN